MLSIRGSLQQCNHPTEEILIDRLSRRSTLSGGSR
jgi:hypothetical protein